MRRVNAEDVQIACDYTFCCLLLCVFLRPHPLWEVGIGYAPQISTVTLDGLNWIQETTEGISVLHLRSEWFDTQY